MKDDYLWDKTGEPDPEIQQLEEVLGTLRYQPRPMELPTHVQIGRSRTLVPRLAIAAAVATILVGGATWWIMHRQNVPAPVNSASNPPPVEHQKAAPETAMTPATEEVVKSKTLNGTVEKNRKRAGIHSNLLAGSRKARPLNAQENELNANDRAKAQAAKEQLLLALRVASAKLSLAQKKAQVGYPGNLIRNQHKVG